MNRKGFLIGFLAGGWLATILIVLLPHLGLLSAQAEDPPGGSSPFGPGSGPGPGPTVNPSSSGFTPRGKVIPGIGTSDSNRRSIALSASVGSGESVVYYFDTVAQRHGRPIVTVGAHTLAAAARVVVLVKGPLARI